MATATSMGKDEILEAISNMSVLELSELVEAFKTKFNVTISAAPVGAAPAAGGAGAGPAAAAEEQTEFAKENEDRPTIKNKMLNGKAVDNAQMKRLASLPSREQMLADLGAGLQSPMAAFVGAVNGFLYMFAGALDALKSQREGA